MKKRHQVCNSEKKLEFNISINVVAKPERQEIPHKLHSKSEKELGRLTWV
jgi:hypothetical protein